MERFLDRGVLIVAGIVCAFLAWCFWHFLGQNAFDVFALLFMVTLLGENYMLKKELRKYKGNALEKYSVGQ